MSLSCSHIHPKSWIQLYSKRGGTHRSKSAKHNSNAVLCRHPKNEFQGTFAKTHKEPSLDKIIQRTTAKAFRVMIQSFENAAAAPVFEEENISVLECGSVKMVAVRAVVICFKFISSSRVQPLPSEISSQAMRTPQTNKVNRGRILLPYGGKISLEGGGLLSPLSLPWDFRSILWVKSFYGVMQGSPFLCELIASSILFCF